MTITISTVSVIFFLGLCVWGWLAVNVGAVLGGVVGIIRHRRSSAKNFLVLTFFIGIFANQGWYLCVTTFVVGVLCLVGIATPESVFLTSSSLAFVYMIWASWEIF